MPTFKPTKNLYLIDPGKDELRSAYLFLPEGRPPEQPVEGVITDCGPDTSLYGIGQRVVYQTHNAIIMRTGKRGDSIIVLLPETAVIATIHLSIAEEAELNAEQSKQFNPSAVEEDGITSRLAIPADLRGDPGVDNPFGR